MTTINYYIRANKALILIGGALTTALFMVIGENRALRKDLERRTAHTEDNVQFIFSRLRKLEETKGDH